eukprot:tig00000241_g20886.t1
MRLTADLVARSAQVTSCLKDREIVLRANKIPAIENLGATQDQYDSIDLSDNDIKKLDGFPTLKRLKRLVLCNNRISRIADNVAESIPNIDTLIMTNNLLMNFADIDLLAGFKGLLRLSLHDNPVSKKQHYRLYVIHKIPSIKLLDFQRVKLKERLASKKLFGGEKGKARAAELAKSKTALPDEDKPKLSEQQVAALKTAIQNASSLEEVTKYEKALKTGTFPPELQA